MADIETYEALDDTLKKLFPDKMIVDIENHENSLHQSYKYLYEELSSSVSDLNNEIAALRNELQNKDRNISEISLELDQVNLENKKLKDTSVKIIDFINKFVSSDIQVVSNISFMNSNEENSVKSQVDILQETISDNPGVYGDKRPSWFTPLQVELSKENIIRKNKSNTLFLFKEKLLFWKKNKCNNQAQASVIADEYDSTRRKNILELINSKCSNEEMYLKYMLLTPGLDKEYYKTLNGAEKLGIDARLVISLLEQPNNYFNKEMIELYVSNLHKGSEYNYKQALAEELIEGKWYIKAKINGQETKFQLVPIDILDTFNENLKTLNNFTNSVVHSNETKDYEQTQFLSESNEGYISNSSDVWSNEFNENTSVSIEFDDSLLL